MPLAPLVASAIDEPSEVVRARFAEHGYLFFRELVSIRDVLDLRDVVLASAERLGWLDPSAPLASGTGVPDLAMGAYDDPRWITLLQEVIPHPCFAALRDHPRVVRAARLALGDSPIESERGDICRVVSDDAPERTTPPHQDLFYVRSDGAIATVWLPLGMCPIELGPLAILPGSHRRGLLPHAGEGVGRQGCDVADDVTWHAADLDCGDVLVFGGLTVHRALPNRTRRRLRLSVDYRFKASAASPARRDASHGTVVPRT